MVDTEDLKKRRDAALAERHSFQPLLDEAYEYAIPYRKSTRDTGKGEKRTNRVFDHTAIFSAFRFAGKLQQDLAPAGQQFFKLEAGPVFNASASKADKDQLTAQLSKISEIAGAFFLDGEWDQAFHEMALDLSAGTGAMLILEGEDDRLARFISVPIDEILLEGGAYGDVSAVFWEKEWALRAIKEEWPQADLGDMARAFDEKPDTCIPVRQDCVFDRKKKRYVLTVWSEKCGKEPLHQAELRVNPWITPRYFRVSGETYGRGPVMLAMPTIKTLNTAQRLTLQAAAIAMLGIYTAVDDGVFNPDNSPLQPGAFWKVARNGGPMGASVSRFPDPRIDVSNLVLQEMRMGVQAALMDQTLPPDGASVRSATEILERVKRLASDHLGAFGRLVAEIIVPVVKRIIEIAYNKRIIPDEIPIDQLLVKVRVVSPLATAREAERVQKIIEWLTIVIQFMGERANRIVKIEDALIDTGRAMGVSSDLIVTEDERAAMDEQEAQAQAAMMATQVAVEADAGAAEMPLPPEMIEGVM